MTDKERRVLTISMVVSMFLWGLSWPSAKVITYYASPINLVIYRYIIVTFTLLPILWYFKIKILLPLKAIPYVLFSAFLLALYSVVMFKGLKVGFAGAGGVFVTTLNPIMAYMLALLIQKKIPSINESAALFLGLIAGMTLLEIWKNSDELWLAGNLLFLLAAFIWALMSRVTALSSRFGSAFSFSFWMYLSTFLILIPLMDFSEIQITIQKSDFLFWSNLFFGGAIVTSLATSIYFYATTKLGSEKASSFIFLVPFSAGISSWLLLGEKFEIHTLIGGTIAILAVYLLQKRKKA
ncbi:MAG: DMT family transporter [Flavobacteriia bacterium]|nr:DMT family transporter [Flavobacteriia bacterium]